MISLYLMKSSEVRKADDRSIYMSTWIRAFIGQKYEVAPNEKRKNSKHKHGFSLVLQKIGGFGNILLEH